MPDDVQTFVALAWAEFQRRQAGREADIARRMYRRGYLAGRAAALRGAPCETAPERHARGDARRLMGARDA